MATAVTFGRRLLIATMTLTLSLAIVTLRPSPAQAQTVVTVINLPAVVIDNQCNREPVALSGDLLTVVTTRPTANGGTTVRSLSVTHGLKGTGLVSGVSYRAVELSGTVVNQLPHPAPARSSAPSPPCSSPRAAPRRPCCWWWWSRPQLLRTEPSATRWSRPTWSAARAARGGPPSGVVEGDAGPAVRRWVRPRPGRRGPCPPSPRRGRGCGRRSVG